MNKTLRWKVLLILLVTGLSVWAFYPPARKIRLGLDLRGGLQLVLRVNTDDALRIETNGTVEKIREELSKRGISGVTLRTASSTEFNAEGVPQAQDAEFRRIADEQSQAVYNRESGVGGAYTFAMKPNIQVTLRAEAVRQALETIERRVNEFGVAEPIIAPYGTTEDQILVQLPGVSDVARAKELIRSTAFLELKLVEQGPAPTREALLQATGGSVSPEMEVVSGVGDASAGERPETAFYLVRKIPVVTGRDLRNARPSLDENNQPVVQFSLKREGAQKFGTATEQNIGRRLAIVLDGRVQSAPVIEGRISDDGQIRGNFTPEEVDDLSLKLRSGALPTSLSYLHQIQVGPTLGAESVRAGLLASITGLAVVAAFMLFYYKLAGVNAIVAVTLNLVVLLGFMAYLDATMTLPGIAGFILTIGMGVDSNVLIFERIKEELAAGKGVKAAVGAGFDRVFLTILDTHIASLIAAAFLFQFGTGPIRGFATTLTFGLLSNVFTAVFVSRTLFEIWLSRRQVATLSI
jgi:preprotein translocase subunit SecD